MFRTGKMRQYSASEVLNMSENKRNGRGAFGKRYYIALALCAAAIVVTGALYYRNANDRQPQPDATENVGNVQQTQANQNIPVIATQPAATTAPTDATQPTENTKIKTMYPVSGEVVGSYAMEALSYNETTRDWRVHNGIDLAAQVGTEVVAAADGEVYTIYDDESLGTTVVIRHLGGYTGRYSCLSEQLSVGVGESVTMGQVIGTVGETAIVETALGPHVHFSVSYRDAAIDPLEFLNSEQ